MCFTGILYNREELAEIYSTCQGRTLRWRLVYYNVPKERTLMALYPDNVNLGCTGRSLLKLYRDKV